MYWTWAATCSSMLGGGQRARVAASGPNLKWPLVPSLLGSTGHVPLARLQLRRMLTVPSPLSRIVYNDGSCERTIPIDSSID
jgi:hypothetical protein